MLEEKKEKTDDLEIIELEKEEVEVEVEEKESSWVKELISTAVYLLVVVALTFLFVQYVGQRTHVNGDSMNNTLFNGEKVVISDVFYSPEREDIIVFHDTNTLNKPVIKRVIATEGETVNISYGHNTMTVTVTDKNGNTFELTEDYITYTHPTYLPNIYTVPEGMVFVMGDNRSNSMDSRNPDIGFVDEREILGKVLFRITPFSKSGTVK